MKGPADLIRRIRASAFHLDVLNDGLNTLEAQGEGMDPDLLCDATERLQQNICAEVLELLEAFREAEALGLMDLLATKARSVSVAVA